MDLMQPPTKQIEDVITLLRELSNLDTPTALIWGEIQIVLRDHALVLEQVTLPKLRDPESHLFEVNTSNHNEVKLDVIRATGARTMAALGLDNAPVSENGDLSRIEEN